jgi:purine-cytosine permease-like protein
VIISVISLLISFCGYNVLNWCALPTHAFRTVCSLSRIARYERLSWLPVLITFVIALGVGGKHLSNPPPAEPATAVTVLSFASTLAGFAITFSGLSSDFTTYYRSDVSAYARFVFEKEFCLT